MEALGIDIGGSGIKGAVVDTERGQLVTERYRLATPKKAGREALMASLEQMREAFGWGGGPVGIGFPGVIRDHEIRTAANLNEELIGWGLGEALRRSWASPVRVFNDADAAGHAEMCFGAGRIYRERGTVLLVTVGTGIGTVLFRDGILVPNLEFGHVEFQGEKAEWLVSERARKEQDLSWKRWGKRFDEFLLYLAGLFQPDRIILGGGGVKKREKVEPLLSAELPVSFAEFGNRAGIIGAAWAAAQAMP